MREGTEGGGMKEGEKGRRKRKTEAVKMACQVEALAVQASQPEFPGPGSGNVVQW